MIGTPTIYDDNESQIGNDLSPPARRTFTWVNWFTSLLTPQQWLNDLVFTLYYGGIQAPSWSAAGSYNFLDNVVYVDYSIYECINPAGITSATPPNQDTTNWIKILDTFVGVGERVLYTGQKSMIEYILNYYFSVGSTTLPLVCWDGTTGFPSHTTQIYIDPGTVGFGFWMSAANSQPLTGYMSATNTAQKNFMGANPTYNPYTFTIFVPMAVDAAITANQVAGVTAEDVIRSIADKYVQAGKLYNYQTY